MRGKTVLIVVLYLALTAVLTGLANSDRDGEPRAWYVDAARFLCFVDERNDTPSEWCWVPFGESNGGYGGGPSDPFDQPAIEPPGA